MIAIKLQRLGKKHQPSYRVVVAPSKSKLGGPSIEDLGTYNPMTKVTVLNKDRVLYWVGVGAQPTTTVHNLLVKQKIVTTPTRAIKMNKPVVKEVVAVATPVASATPAPVVDEPVAVEPAPAEPVATVEPVAPVAEAPADAPATPEVVV